MLNKDVCPREEVHLTGKPHQKSIGLRATNHPTKSDEAGLPDENLKVDKIEMEVTSKLIDKSELKAKTSQKLKDARLPHDNARLPHEKNLRGKKLNGQEREPFLKVVDRDPRRRFGRRNDDQVT